MIRSIGTPDTDIIYLGRKQGLDIYIKDADTITVRPGSIHIHNGFINRVIHVADFTDFTVTGAGYTAARWYFVTINDSGTIQTRIAARTGYDTLSVRPPMEVGGVDQYGYVAGDNTKFKHHKQGYYYAENERILGAVWLLASTKVPTYVINNGNGSDEVGENSNGSWTRIGEHQTTYETFTTDGAGSKTVVFPVAFVGNVPDIVGSSADTGSATGINFSVISTTITGCTIYSITGTSGVASASKVGAYSADGKWHA